MASVFWESCANSCLPFKTKGGACSQRSALPSGQRSSAHHPCNKQSHQKIWMGYCHIAQTWPQVTTMSSTNWRNKWVECIREMDRSWRKRFQATYAAWWDSSTTQAWGTWYITCKNELPSMAIMLKNGGKFKFSVNVLVNANKHVAHCEK